MSKKLILHIGTEKTGTTSIQKFLNLNKDELLNEGIFYPMGTCGTDNYPNHRKLATACFNLGHEDDSFKSLRLSQDNFNDWRDSFLSR